MRCPGCGRHISDEEAVYAGKGTACCYPCYQRWEASGRHAVSKMWLILLLLVGALAAGMIWLFPEITRR